MKKKVNIITFGTFSWERPIEDEIITFCENMARQFREAESRNKETGWFANNSFSEQCGATAMAYETVAKHVEREVTLRQKIKSKP